MQIFTQILSVLQLQGINVFTVACLIRSIYPLPIPVGPPNPPPLLDQS